MIILFPLSSFQILSTSVPTQLHFIYLTFTFSFNKKGPKIKIKTDKNLISHTTKNQNEVCFILVSYSWAWILAWSVVDVFSITPLGKTDFPSPNRCQLQITPCLEGGLCAYFPFSVLGFCLVWTCADLGHAISVSVISCMYMWALMYVCQSWCDWKMFFLETLHHLWPFQSSYVLFSGSLSREGRGLVDILLSDKCFKVLHFLHIIQLWISMLHIPIYSKNVSGEGCAMLCSVEERHEKEGGKM